jgi:hypothetical protein
VNSAFVTDNLYGASMKVDYPKNFMEFFQQISVQQKLHAYEKFEGENFTILVFSTFNTS